MNRACLPVLLGIGLFLAGASPVADPGAEPSPLDPLLAKIRIAFLKGDAKPLREICSPKSRVHLILTGTEVPSGYLSPDQMYFLLDRFFDGLKTTDFRFHEPSSSPGRSTRTANWKFQEGEQEPRLMKLQFRFTREGKDWFLTEIRALP